ncbi:hypothetical protein GN958_ATG00016 [Phytophthora infestans]|uniref:Uncharacterized protein n=1 Tax=Phytophthora infestans TaxID=4787 RepID=A0A8S9VBT4_PHYIN|nr:hypothetical protein GN958_ATG01161 [Phytophthora infestans]KAF4150793.1 hypothetical protein GN958_ATG00016 [Phytophthora infestans]KAI9987076.1 hypothetical protein PInf_022934 [Phytophthora infestans]
MRTAPGAERCRATELPGGRMFSVSERAAVDLESNTFSGVDTLSNSAKPEQEEKEQDEVQLSDYSGSANVFTTSH